MTLTTKSTWGRQFRSPSMPYSLTERYIPTSLSPQSCTDLLLRSCLRRLTQLPSALTCDTSALLPPSSPRCALSPARSSPKLRSSETLNPISGLMDLCTASMNPRYSFFDFTY